MICINNKTLQRKKTTESKARIPDRRVVISGKMVRNSPTEQPPLLSRI